VAEADTPIAVLIKGLKRRGLLDSTLLVWMGEFGRTPDKWAELRAQAGRERNTYAHDDLVCWQWSEAGRPDWGHR
jgi:arylsulfatase A-like enzyme